MKSSQNNAADSRSKMKFSEKAKFDDFRDFSRYNDEQLAYECVLDCGYSIQEYNEWNNSRLIKTELINKFVVKRIKAGELPKEVIEDFHLLFIEDVDALEVLNKLSVVFMDWK
ncbi:MAG: hypothetical protein LBC87_01745 [Fibromonadaceae bacterium]|nr:hypothetical protein [Fibromonadaceae bacterium]